MTSDNMIKETPIKVRGLDEHAAPTPIRNIEHRCEIRAGSHGSQSPQSQLRPKPHGRNGKKWMNSIGSNEQVVAT
jgi:hypothetical protein